MTKKELTKEIREILGRKDVTLRLRDCKTKIGETHAHLVGLYGNFTNKNSFKGGVDLEYKNDSLFYSDDSVNIIERLKEHGFNVFDALIPKYEILVEVDCWYMGDDDVRHFDWSYNLRKSNFTYSWKKRDTGLMVFNTKN
jgi:hypothetical protein